VDLLEAIRTRKSVRGYKPDPVQEDVLRSILEVSFRSPSALNGQPWEVTVVAGPVLEKIKDGNARMLASGAAPRLDIPMEPLQGVHRQRQVELAMRIFDLMGIERENQQQRARWMERGFRFFDAPAAYILYADRSVDTARAQFDVGILSQTICLVALIHGLGTCIGVQGVMYPDVVRRFTGIPESKRISISIAIGYPDWEFPANRLVSAREPVESLCRWCGFE